MRLRGILLTVIVLLGVALAAANWDTLTASTPLNLLVATVQLPLGLTLLIAAVGLSLLFFALSLLERAGQLSQTNQLERQLNALQAKLNKKRLDELEALETRLGERLMGLESKLGDESDRLVAAQRDGLEALRAEQRERLMEIGERVLLVRNELAADIAKTEEALRRHELAALPAEAGEEAEPG